MANIEQIKEEIGWLKVVFAVVVAVDASLIAWLAQHYASASRVLVVSGFLGALILSLSVAYVNRRAYRLIRGMENL
ncbi:hypothetical protein [uncultured Salinisphaera sp.]|uniref:hypothetical protein n=1 Tax=uncultured Salinisphaera sp. TaxID=359372 RepID=UPI0032B12B80|tara:strand:+ start:254 stop:481 length:228 start_codon:yes stop_codon:yes gene_type:complete